MIAKDFSSRVSPGKFIRVRHFSGDPMIEIHSREHGEQEDILLDRACLPALALAVLETAGIVHHDPEDTPYDASLRTENMGPLNIAAFHLAQHVNQAAKAAAIAAEEAAALEKLTKRRDKIARELGCSPLGYKDTFDTTQRAIDRIIELEDKAQS